jgi:hypothetical protein
MMVILMLTPIVLSEGFTHDATDYQIATDPLFSDDSIVAEVLGDEENKLIKTFDLNLDPEVEYYARARYILNNFITEWSNVDIILPKDVNDLDLHMDIPSMVSIPIVSIDYELDNVPTTFFNITTNNIITTSNARHKFTTYIITDTDGNVYMSNIEDGENLTTFKIIKDKLLEDKTFILYVQHGSTSGDVSDFGKIVFKTTSLGDVDIISDTDLVKGEDLLIKLITVDDVDTIYTDLYAVSYTENTLLTSLSTDVFSYSIDASYFMDEVDDYMLAIKYKYSDGTYSPTRYIPVKTY